MAKKSDSESFALALTFLNGNGVDERFAAQWILDGIANSTHQLMQFTSRRIADNLSEAREAVAEGGRDDDLVKLATYIERDEHTNDVAKAFHNQAASLWCEVTGNTTWKPYSKGGTNDKSKTAAAEFFKKRLA